MKTRVSCLRTPLLASRAGKSVGLVAALLSLTGSVAFADGDTKTGALLARHWCGACHGTGNKVASDAVPSLESIAERAHDGQAWLRAWLADPHPPMPNLTLSRSEINDIVAYLATLTTK